MKNRAEKRVDSLATFPSEESVQEMSSDRLRRFVPEQLEICLSASKRMNSSLMLAGCALAEIQEKEYFRHWKSNKTGKCFESFDEYIQAEGWTEAIGGRSTIYSIISVAENLFLKEGISAERLSGWGKTASTAIARVAKHKHDKLDEVVQTLDANPGMPLAGVQQLCANALEGRQANDTRFRKMEFWVPPDGWQDIKNALDVIQLLEPLNDPDAPAMSGIHLANICREYLSGNIEAKTLADLEEARRMTKKHSAPKLLPASLPPSKDDRVVWKCE